MAKILNDMLSKTYLLLKGFLSKIIVLLPHKVFRIAGKIGGLTSFSFRPNNHQKI